MPPPPKVFSFLLFHNFLFLQKQKTHNNSKIERSFKVDFDTRFNVVFCQLRFSGFLWFYENVKQTERLLETL